MKRLPYNQMVVGLDKLFFGYISKDDDQDQERLDTIEAYLEACGWSWDDIIKEMLHEEVGNQATTEQSHGDSNPPHVN